MDCETILAILDAAAARYTFPVLDNGYFYLAATRLSVYRSRDDWAMVIEIFNHNPRAFRPTTDLYVFASRFHNRDAFRHYPGDSEHSEYLRKNPHNEFVTIYPIQGQSWIDADEPELLASSGSADLRDELIPLPEKRDYARFGIALQEERPCVFEFCRYLAAIRRDQVLATTDERRSLILPKMEQILQLEEWHHPDLLNDEMPGQTETFRLFATVLETGDASLYITGESPNTHWSNWNQGGTL